jgi:hypothetical protein
MQDSSEVSKDLLNGQSMKIQGEDFIEKFIDKVVVDKPNLLEIIGEDGLSIGYLTSERLSQILKK